MFSKIGARKLVIYALLAAHTLWIMNHLRMVYLDRVNPWLIGGYGMYTVPRPKLVVRFIDFTDLAAPVVVPHRELKLLNMSVATRFSNIGRAFRCAHLPDDALSSLFLDNPQLAGRKIAIVYYDQKFIGKAPWVTPRLQGEVMVDWKDSKSLAYTSTFCGDTATGTINLP